MILPTNEQWMRRALACAVRGGQAGEVPVGAVLVGADGALLGEGFNQPIRCHDPSAHAEIMALRQAGEICQNYRFPGATLYVTLEPCTMCVGAMIHARLAKVVFAAREPRAGSLVSARSLLDTGFYNHRFEVEEGLCADESSRMLRAFFRQRRLSAQNQLDEQLSVMVLGKHDKAD